MKIFKNIEPKLRDAIARQWKVAGYTFCEVCGDATHYKNLIEHENEIYHIFVCKWCKAQLNNQSHYIE